MFITKNELPVMGNKTDPVTISYVLCNSRIDPVTISYYVTVERGFLAYDL